MKATFSVLAALVLVSQAHAQQYVAPQGQRAVQYDEANNTVVEVAPQQSVQVQPAPVIVQQQPQQQVYIRRVQEQPVTVVEGSLLKESKADQLRKARTDMEADTEAKIVEKLEEARMRDERERAEKLFGNSALNGQAAAAASAQVQVQPAPPVMAQPAAPPTAVDAQAKSAAVSSGTTSAAAAEAKLEVKEEPKQPEVNVKEEIKAALDEREANKHVDKQQIYVGALAGMGEYPDVINMRGTGSAGFSVGLVTKNRIIVEGSFLYSSYDIEDLTQGSGAFPAFKNLDQYNTSAAVKFQILPGQFRPTLGGVVSYVHRSYSDTQGWYPYPGTQASTDAVDVGVTAGLDVLVADNFSIGADAKYLMNVTSKQDSRYQQSMVYRQYNYGTPVEKLNYYTLSLVGKFMF